MAATPDFVEITALLRAWHAGDEHAYRRLSAVLYAELRRQATHYLTRGAAGAKPQATTLVHEAFIRLAGARHVAWQDRNHFLAVAASTMRRVLIDLARAHATAKRGAEAVHVPLESDVAASGPELVNLIAVDEALTT